MYGYVKNSYGVVRYLIVESMAECFQESVAKKIPGSTTIPNSIPAAAIPLGVEIAAAWPGLSISVPRA